MTGVDSWRIESTPSPSPLDAAHRECSAIIAGRTSTFSLLHSSSRVSIRHVWSRIKRIKSWKRYVSGFPEFFSRVSRFTLRGADLNQRFYHRDGSFEATLWYSIDRLRTLEIFYFLFFYNINFQFRMIPFELILTVFFVISRQN